MALPGQYNADPVKNERLEQINLQMMKLAGSRVSMGVFLREYAKLQAEWDEIGFAPDPSQYACEEIEIDLALD